MQRKSVKTILFGLILGIPATYAATTDSNVGNNNNVSLSPIQPGFYYSVGYTYAMIKNANLTNLSLKQLPSSNPDYPYLSYENKYGGGSGANAKISYLWRNHWGAEVNLAWVKISSTQNVNGTTNLNNAPVNSQYINRVNTFFTEALGEYAFSLTPNLALLAKTGAGYEYQNQALSLNGVFTETLTTFSTTTQQKDHYFGPAAAAELRYAMTRNVSLGFELNDLAAHQNIIAANANVICRF